MNQVLQNQKNDVGALLVIWASCPMEDVCKSCLSEVDKMMNLHAVDGFSVLATLKIVIKY